MLTGVGHDHHAEIEVLQVGSFALSVHTDRAGAEACPVHDPGEEEHINSVLCRADDDSKRHAWRYWPP